MSYFLVVLIVIAIIAILYVWYITKYQNAISDSDPLKLDTDENKLIGEWYKNNLSPTYDFTTTTYEIAAKFLKIIHKITTDPTLIVVGDDLNNQYYNLTKIHLINEPTKVDEYVRLNEPTKVNESNLSSDCIFHIRDVFGIPGEIAIIYDEDIRKQLRSQNDNYDLLKLNNIMTMDPEGFISSYLQNVLNARWKQLLELNNPNISNNSGSYLCIDEADTNLPENIIATRSNSSAKINLLCTNLEFEALIKRLTA